MRNRRALATMVGAVFFVVVMASTIGYVSYSIGLIDDLAKSVEIKQALDYERNIEEFEVTKIETVGNEFNITVQNVGKIPVKIARLWVENVSDANLQNLRYTIDNEMGPGQKTTNIGQSLGLVAKDTQAYQMKLVTERGNSKEFFVNSPTVQPLKMQLFANPDIIPEKFRSTLRFTVENNMTSQSTLFNLKPASMQVSPFGGATITPIVGPIPSSYDALKSGDVAEFIWVYELDGSDASGATFTASLQNPYPGNDAVEIIDVKTVEASLESGVSLQTQGFTSSGSAKDIIYLHQETTGTPGDNEYQLDSRSPDGTGITISVDQLNKSFFTKNGTSNVNITSGNWNFGATYFSNLVPSSVTDPDIAYHFSCDNCGGTDDTVDSTGNTPNLDKYVGSPSWQTSGGPDNSAYYAFTEDAFNDNNWPSNTQTEPGDEPDSTAIWVRVPNLNPSNNFEPIFHWGNHDASECDESNDDFYALSIGDGTSGNRGKPVFEYQTKRCSQATTCVGPDRIDDGSWTHIVVVRPADDQCIIYVNGTKVVEDTTTASYSDNFIDADRFYLADFSNNSDELTGDLDALMHWGNHELTQQEVTDLYHTNYGTNATRLDFIVDKTDQDGNFISNIQTDNSYQMNFIDPATKSTSSTTYDIQTSNSTVNKYGIYNYTWTESSWVNFTAGQRMNFTINWINDVHNLPLNMRIDGPGFVLPNGPSFIQLPAEPTNGFASYVTFKEGQQPQVSLTNQGPDGIWLTFIGTRITFDSTSNSNSFAGFLHQVNGTGVNEDVDSMFIDVGESVDLLFYIPADAPDRSTSSPGNSTQIPQGTYDGNMYISGYDDKGSSFLRTITFGQLQVSPP